MTVQTDGSYVEVRDNALATLEDLRARRKATEDGLFGNKKKIKAAKVEVSRARKKVKPWWLPGLKDRREVLSLAVERRSDLVCNSVYGEGLVEDLSEQILEWEATHEKYRLLSLGANPEVDPSSGELLNIVTTIARLATAHNYGDTVLAGQVLEPGVVEVLMSSWPRAQEARRALEASGYATSDGVNSFGQWVRVSSL